MMAKCLWRMVCAITLVTLSSVTHASLVGILPFTQGGADFQAYYDDVADLSWMVDANLSASNTFGITQTVNSIPPTGEISMSGQMNWFTANSWIAAMNSDGGTGYLGVDAWRLPTTLQPDASCSIQVGYGGSRGDNCSGSEMGNLYYNVLGGIAGDSITTTHNSNYALFSGIADNFYWSATEVSPPAGDVHYFSFRDGSQRYVAKTGVALFVWAVADGNISAVPVPPAIWLFGSGLLGLIGISRRKK